MTRERRLRLKIAETGLKIAEQQRRLAQLEALGAPTAQASELLNHLLEARANYRAQLSIAEFERPLGRGA
jgi:hypothetical protein